MSVWMVYDMVFLLCGCYGLSLCAKVRMSDRLEDRKLGLPRAVHMVTLGVCLAAAVVFFAVQHKAVKEFGDLEENK